MKIVLGKDFFTGPIYPAGLLFFYQNFRPKEGRADIKKPNLIEWFALLNDNGDKEFGTFDNRVPSRIDDIFKIIEAQVL